ncbi:hypothetical protein [Kitasatospora sp. NPDC085879]|jgi:hypothetical protein|uniref:hypothetical protein n=1 Tax=Kitasatospora sp. NPDC085879 TaxID=3154769 RepID=UPI000BB0D3BF|nr:hypothetical protein [Streptomyces sp. TLI_235]PBC79692.1 hypothetical protein BX265_4505 [Streptomyces sp. TLI_235]
MGIFDRFRHKPHDAADPAERAALAHDEAADAFGDTAERSRTDAQHQVEQMEEDRRAAADMTAEGDPWD